MSELTLYVDAYWSSPYALSAFVALEEKRLKYQLEELSLHQREHRVPFYQEGSLTGRVPALKHGDFWLSESSAIAEYLAETFPSPEHPRLFPEDLKERARARQLMAWVRSDLMPIREERSTSTVWFADQRTTQPLSPSAIAAVETLLRVADRLIGDGRTTLFDHWCLADADFGMMLQRLNVNGHPLPAKVKAYAEAQWRRPSVRKFVDHARPPWVPYP